MPRTLPQLSFPRFGSTTYFWMATTAVFLWLLLSLQTANPIQTWPIISQEQAITTAVHRLDTLPNGLRLHHPQHQVDFHDDGFTFIPHHGAPAWSWELAHIGTATDSLVTIMPTAPKASQPTLITYQRGSVIEQYVARSSSIEQQFLLTEKPLLAGQDLHIEGHISSSGDFITTATGWAWRNISGEVSLGNVTVIDATGRELPATMEVTAVSTEIVINGRLLENATYPVLIDPEIGSNDFQITHHGADFDFDGENPNIVYNPQRNEFFAIWEGDTEGEGLVKGETEIFGQRLDALTGLAITSPIRISHTGPDADSSHDASEADITYNTARNEYFVVWAGDDINGEFEIWGQRISAIGQTLGNNIRLSHMGPDADIEFDAEHPAVTYNSTNNQYLVVWAGDHTTDGETEIFGQRVGPTGELVGNQEAFSDMGPDASPEYGAHEPDVAYNKTNNEYLIVWRGDDNTLPFVSGENEIFAQRVNGATGFQVGNNDFPVSDMGSEGKSSYDAKFPAVTYNSRNNEFFVVWSADDNTGTLVNDEVEIFGQRISGATGLETGSNDIRLSQMGPDGNVNFEANMPDVTYNDADNEYLVVWQGNTQAAGLNDTEIEIYAQIVDGNNGLEIDTDFRLSSMGPDGNANYNALNPAVAYGDGTYYITWSGDDNRDGLLDEEYEIFGQQIDAQTGEELGVDDYRLSEMGPLGYPDLAGFSPDIAFNPQANEYLVVWSGNDNIDDLSSGEQEIFAQRINASNGNFVGGMMRLSDMGTNGDNSFDAIAPAVTYNSQNNEFFVVWAGDDDSGFLVNNEMEIFGQRVNAANGQQIGGDIRLSDMGPDGSVEFEASNPDVAYSSANNHYLVVWSGDDNTLPSVDGEFEIYGQLVAATGTQIGVNDFRISDMGPNGDSEYEAVETAVTYNSASNEFFVVWSGDDNTPPLTNGEGEIFGQRISSATGQEVGTNDRRLSDAGPDGSGGYDAKDPDVAYNSQNNEYLVVWSGEDNVGSTIADEIEIFGQRLNGLNASEIGENDFRISHVAQDGNVLYGGFAPAVSYSAQLNEYFVVWHSDDNINGFVDEEFEVYGQRLSHEGEPIEAITRLSDMGQNGNLEHIALDPAVAYAEGNSEYLVVWSGNDDTGAEIHNGFEIFGQRFAATRNIYLPFVEK